ncbi:hypothetical protein TNCT_535521 [Trichonephila clavata]|uniref:Uncharacterized protein n=1 Tax=Trichonephila clavata TaxID=2740835 RepID=A0A8X6LY19_TRICU|nr:hypothetical protein TNCT_535521 [Trichonephila clavata]
MSRQRRQTSIELWKLIIKHTEDGKSVREISEIVKRSHSTVHDIIKRYKTNNQLLKFAIVSSSRFNTSVFVPFTEEMDNSTYENTEQMEDIQPHDCKAKVVCTQPKSAHAQVKAASARLRLVLTKTNRKDSVEKKLPGKKAPRRRLLIAAGIGITVMVGVTLFLWRDSLRRPHSE